MASKQVKKPLSFKEAVEATPDIASGFKTGLNAFGTYSNKIEITSLNQLQGSVDIDNCTRTKYPNANRWDYALSYKGEVFFVEVHSANTSEVKVVLKKFQWLKDWLIHQAPEINRLKAKSNPPFIWLQSKNFQIPKTAPQYFAAKKMGLLPLKKLVLN